MLKNINHFIEYLFFKIFQKIFHIIGFKKTSILGGYIFKIIGPYTKYNKIIKNNMSLIYNNKDTLQIEVNKNLEQIGKTFFEFFLINNLNYIISKVTNEDVLKKIKNENQSYLFISAHYGNWEITRNYLVNYGFNLHSIYRHANNKFIENEIQNIRKMSGSYFYKKGKESAKNMIKAIKNNNHLAILIDQKDNRGDDINFFDKQAKTNTGFASLALKYKKNICPIRSLRKNDGSFEIIIDNPIAYQTFKEKSEIELTEFIYKNYIEKWILENPSQWLWAHKRWGT